MSFEKISISLHLQEVRELESQFSQPHAKFAERLKKSKKIDKKLFAIDTCLGKGSFGQVFKAKFARDVDVAIKVINWIQFAILICSHSQMIDAYTDDTLAEFQIHSQLVHLNVVSLFHHCFIKNSFDVESLWIIMDLCDSDFEKYLTQTLSEFDYDDREQKLLWIYQLLQALEFIHANNVLHRDLKPGNILLKHMTTTTGQSYWIPKLADFGMARQFRHQDSKTIRVGGTEVYNAPELWHVKYQNGID